MKKLLSLITLLACAGSLYAAEAGTLTPSSVGFESNEGYVADTVISNTLQETGKTTYQWWSAGSDEGETGTIKLYNVAAENPPAQEGDEAVTPASETEAGLSKYVYANQTEGNFVNLGPGNQYLNVETTTGKPLYRTLATWENNFRWVKTENGEKTYWTDDGDPAEEEQGTVWQKEYQVNSLADIAGVEIGSEGKVIDTLVQFTASETAPELADGDKLVVWLKQQTEDDKPADWQDQIKVGTEYTYTWTDDEGEKSHVYRGDEALSAEEMTAAGIPENTVPTESEVMEAHVWPCYTNLMVTAGQLASDGTVVKKDFKVSESVEPDTWYRLTIRAIANVLSNPAANQPGFAIYLDGVAVACMDDDYQTKLLNGVEVDELSSTAKGLCEEKKLFISAVSSDKIGATALAAVGFDGTGKIDDLTINTVEAGPQFAMGTRLFKVEWDNGLTGFTIVAKGSDGAVISNETFSVEGGAVANEFVFAPGAETYEISALTFASGSTFTEVTANGATMVETSGVYSFTKLAFAPVVKIGVATTLAYVEGIPDGFSNFADAIAAAIANGKKLTLAADVTLNSAISVANGSTLIIDLAGKSIYYTPVSDEFGVYVPMIHGGDGLNGTASITVLDSVGGGKIGFTPEVLDAGVDLSNAYLIDTMVSGVANVTIGTADDKGATFDGPVFLMDGTMYSGKFNCSYNATTDLLGAVAQGSVGPSLSEDQLYWVVTQSAGGDTPDDPEPTDPVITINVADATNATVTVDGVAYDAGATYKYTDTAVVIVATANDGYTYTGVTAEGWTIAGDGTTATNTVSGITADVTVNVPAALQKADEPEGPTDWDDVDDETDVSDVVDSTTQTALEGSAVTAKDIKKWAVDHDVDFVSGGISVTPEALMLNCANTAEDIAEAKEAFKVDDTIFAEIMSKLENLKTVDFSSLRDDYPYADFEVVPVTLGEEASENAKFFKLKMTLK